MTDRTTFALAFAGALAAVLAIHLLHFPGSVPDFREASNGGVLLDVSPAFTVDATYERLRGYGEAGRRNYRFRNLTVDLVLPLSLLPFLVMFMRRALTPLPPGPLRVTLLSLPFLYVIFDLAENASVLALLAHYPHRLELLAEVLPYLTMIKRAASLLALLVPAVGMAVRWLRRRSHPQTG